MKRTQKVSVHTFDIKSKVIRKINVPLEEGGYIPRIRFTQDPNKLAVMTLNRHQKPVRPILCRSAQHRLQKLAVRDESDTYIREKCIRQHHFLPGKLQFRQRKERIQPLVLV